MGCNSSSLAGDSFDGIDATALSTKKAPRRSQKSPYPAESDLSAEAYAHATPTMTRGDRGPDPETKEGKKEKSTLGSHMGTLPFNSRPKVKVVSSLDPSAGRAIDDINPPDPPRKLYLDGKELKPKQKQTSFSTAAMPWTDVSKRVDADGEAAEEAGASKLPFKPVSVGSRTDEDRMAAIPAGKKKLGLYQRYTNYRLGVGEERDPETGRGKYTGMTKEETMEYVGRTRGFGMPGDKHQHSIGGFGYGITGVLN